MKLLLLLLLAIPIRAQLTIDAFASGISRRSTYESPYSAATTGFRSNWAGAAGLGAEVRVRQHFSIELAVEKRRDVESVTLGGRLCGPYHNTCFATHRVLLSSTPISLLARYELPLRFSPIASAGVRYVPSPDVRDLSASREPAFPLSFISPRPRRVSAEVSLGALWRMSRSVAVYAEARSLTRIEAEWDPKHRIQAGVRIRIPARS